MSSEFRILSSLPSTLISVPPYLLTRTLSPFLTSKAILLPSSSVLPVPKAKTLASVGFSLAESGMMIPPSDCSLLILDRLNKDAIAERF